MGYMKNEAIDILNAGKPLYQVDIIVPDGEDDYHWETWMETENYTTACGAVQYLRDKGHEEARMFDPYVGKVYDVDGNEILNP